MIDNLGLYEAHEREQARQERLYRREEIEEEMEEDNG